MLRTVSHPRTTSLAQDKWGQGLLAWAAAQRRCKPFVQRLIDNGLDLNPMDKVRLAPGDVQVLLSRQCAPLMSRAQDGSIALTLAADWKNKNIAYLLVMARADLMAKIWRRRSALMPSSKQIAIHYFFFT